jgi:hypothetical protein
LSRATGRSIDSFIAIGNRQNKLGEMRRGSRNQSQSAASNVPPTWLFPVKVTFSGAAYLLTSANAAGEKMRNGVRFISIFSNVLDIFINAMKWRRVAALFFSCARSMNNDPSPFCRRRPTTSLAEGRKGKIFQLSESPISNLLPTMTSSMRFKIVSFPLQQAKSFEKFHTNSSENQRD